MKPQSFFELSQAPDLGTFQRRLISLAYAMEFDLINVAHVIDRPGQVPLVLTAGNTPGSFSDASRSIEDASRDPVLRRLQKDSLPFIYDQTTYVDTNTADLWEEQAMFGYVTGVSVSLHLANGATFMIGVDRSRPLPSDDSQVVRMLADLQLLAVHAQHAAARLLLPVAKPVEIPKLTSREVDVLALARQGMSSAGMSDHLKVSEATVNFHVANAMRKLGAKNRISAVNIAADLGLL